MKILPLVPAPAEVHYESDTTINTKGFTIDNSDPFANVINLLAKQLPLAFTGRKPSLPLKCVQTGASAGTFPDSVDIDEAYELEIRANGVIASASSNAGIYHALQTLRQLTLAGLGDDGSFVLPALRIVDRPRFSWRGFMLDCSRHFYTVTFIMKMIDAASMHHLNVFHWHLTDDQGWRLPIDGYPKLTEIGAWRRDSKTTWQDHRLGGFYSKEDIREIVRFAAERHVEVVPEVDLPGHASAILASYPELGCTGGPYKVEDRYGIFSDVLCAGNDAIFPLFEAIFNTIAELFPSKYVHIGGDEVKFDRWETCPKCRARLETQKLGKTHQLQSWITVRLANMLEERGKTPIGWDEVLEGTEVLGLPQDMIVMSWRGREGGIQASAKGHRVIMTALTDGCYLNFKHLDNAEEPGHLEVATIEKSYGMDPVIPGMSAEQESLVLGGQCNLWSEVIYASRIAEYMYFPRMGAIAESLWSPKATRSLESFENRLSAYGKVLDALDLLHYRGPVR